MGDVQADKSQALARFKGLQEQITAQAYLKNVTETGQKLAGLSERLETLHGRGYAFGRDLKERIEALQARWLDVETEARAVTEQAVQPVETELRGLQLAYETLSTSEGVAAEIQANKLAQKLTLIAQALTEATRQIDSVLGDVPDRIGHLETQLVLLETYMKRIEEACFPFNRDETVYIAVEVEWKKGKNTKDNPDGIFYVTDQRLIMEQKEKQGGFMGLGGKIVQELAWQAPLSSVREVTPEIPGAVELARFTFGEDGPFAETAIELRGGVDAAWFVTQVRRAISGEIDDERRSI
jgi:hypothetical protein